MDTGVNSVQLVVIVLVVVAQGVSSFTKWLKRKREEARRNDAAMGLPGSRDEAPPEPEAEAIDWDTWGQDEESQAPVPDARKQPNGSIPDEVAQPTAPAPVAQVDPSPSNPAPSASMHRVIAAHAARPGAGRVATMGSRPSLRSMMLGKIVLDPPVSARHGSARSPRG